VEVVAVSDVNESAARKVIENYPEVRFVTDANELINDSEVDAVILTSASTTHEDYCLSALKANKRVFCEKPLSESAQGAKRVVDAEIAYGEKMIQIGFNRRYDTAFLEMKQRIEQGVVGAPLLSRCSHHVPMVFKGFRTENIITEAAVHEIDGMSWLVGDHFVSAQIIFPKKSEKASDEVLYTPLIMMLKTSTGIIVDADIFVKGYYGYDIQCEIIGEKGVVKLPDLAKVIVRTNNAIAKEISNDGLAHFEQSYCSELQAWVDATERDRHSGGPDAWDGYAAAIVCDACLRSLESGREEVIGLTERPAFYR